MGQQRPVLEQGDPRLRQVAQPVTQWGDRLQQLIDDLIVTAEKTHGVGIAAPQVGTPWQVLILASWPNLRYPQAPTMPPTALINPRIIAHSEDQVSGWEGCLSVPDRRGMVWRYREIEVDYCDRQGKPQRQVFTDFVARIFQHEYDHLMGRLFVDHVADPTQLLTEADYQAQIIDLIAG